MTRGRNTSMKKQSRRGEVRACGHVWYPWQDGVATMVGDKFEVVTWRFGSIHQSKVFVIYPGSKDPMDRDRIGVCLSPGKTRKEAMQRGLDWVAAYKAPDSPDELFPKLFRRWRTLYRTRADIIDQLFFVIGNGYSWVDGAIVSTSDEGDEERPKAVPPPGSPKYLSSDFFMLPHAEQRVITDAHYDAAEEALPVGPLPDDGAPRNFYPVCQYSGILCIPDDVRPDWLAVAYEAALMLRDRQTMTPMPGDEDLAQCKKNIKYGERVVAELDAKYPHLKTHVSIHVDPGAGVPQVADPVVSPEERQRVKDMVSEILKRGETRS